MSSVYSVDFFWGSLKARCFVVTQHSESRVSHSVFATPKHLAFRLPKKSTEHTDDTESRNKQPRAGSPTASLAQGDTLRTQQNILQSSCKDKSKIRATKTSVCNLKRLHLPYIFHHPADGDKNGKSYK